MTNLFLSVLDMSLTASVVIGAVLLARFLLRKQPKVLSYALWLVVLFRLLCPVSFSAPVSVVEVARLQVAAVSENASRAYHLTAAMPTPPEPVTQAPQRLDAAPAPVLPETAQPIPEEPGQPVSLETLAACIWLAGMGVLVLSSLLSFSKLRRSLVGAAPLWGNVFLADHIPTPFVLGIFRPRIYLPSAVSEKERPYILAHEQHHIRRLDHIFKLLSYLALCLHWFNPLVWLAFILSGKDMEMSCDEAVIRKLGEHTRADYAETLLRLTTRRSVIAGMPLAFGEGDTESRVKNLALWRKPKLWAVVIGAILCALAVFLCAGNPMETSRKIADPEGFAFDLPVQYQVEVREDDFYFLKKNETAGGLRRHEIPEEYRGNALEAIGEIFLRENPEYGESKDILRGTEADGCLSLQLISAEDGSTTQHHFYEHGIWLYELWFDSSIMPEEDQRTIRGSLERPEPIPVPTEEQTSATEEVEPVTIGLNLPMDVVDLDFLGTGIRRELRFFPVAGGQVVPEYLLGGVRFYETPEKAMDFADMEAWLQELGVPQILDEEHDWMAGSSLYADLEVSFADAAGQETWHYYYIKEQQVFELWLDPAALDAMTRAAIVQSVTFGPEAAIERTLPRIAEYPFEEDVQAHKASAAMERCREALEELQGSDYHVKLYSSRYGSSLISDTETQYHYFSGENWLQVNNPRPRDAYAEVVQEGRPFRALYRNGEYYNNLSSENDVLTFVSDDKAWQSSVWLHRFRWDAQEVVYRATTPAGKGQCIQWQVMAPYDENLQGCYNHYFVSFIFDENVVLQRLEITAYCQHPKDGDYSIQETISILGRGFSEEEIEKAWRQAEKA